MKVAVLGASGRMGTTLLGEIGKASQLTLCGAITRPGHPLVGEATGHDGVVFSADIATALAMADFAVDFALADRFRERGRACADAACPWVVGTTGLASDDLGAVREIAGDVPVLLSANMSLGVNACFASAALLSRTLGERYDVDILDIHHRKKRDAPSGTALEFGRLVAAARGKELDDVLWREDGSGERPPGSIAFAAVRAGRHAGEHRIVFSGSGDDIELVHRAADRGIFARGALAAGQWLVGRAPGVYQMADFVADGVDS